VRVRKCVVREIKCSNAFLEGLLFAVLTVGIIVREDRHVLREGGAACVAGSGSEGGARGHIGTTCRNTATNTEVLRVRSNHVSTCYKHSAPKVWTADKTGWKRAWTVRASPITSHVESGVAAVRHCNANRASGEPGTRCPQCVCSQNAQEPQRMWRRSGVLSAVANSMVYRQQRLYSRRKACLAK